MRKKILVIMIVVTAFAVQVSGEAKDNALDELLGAVLSGDLAKIQQLIVAGVDVNSRNERGLTPLMAAAFAGNPQAVKVFLENGANVNARGNLGITALIVAATRGHLEVVNLLIDRGADPGVRSEEGLSAYDMAKGEGHKEVADILVARTPINEVIPTHAELVSTGGKQKCLPIRSMPVDSAKQVGCARIGDKMKLSQISTNTNWLWVTEPVNGWVLAAHVKTFTETDEEQEPASEEK